MTTAPALGAPADDEVQEHPVGAALGELVAKVPTASPGTTGPDGTTLVGTEGSARADASAAPATSASPGSSIATPDADAGAPTGAGPRTTSGSGGARELSGLSLERAAREQIYWRLQQKCKTASGEVPPARAVTLSFTLRPDGSVSAASVRAVAASHELESVARCVERTFSASGFVGPAAGRGTSVDVSLAWPSVD